MAGSVIATVTSTSGQAYARNAKGELREIRSGDVLKEGENVITPSGGHVELEMADGHPLYLSDMPEMAMTRDLLNTLEMSRAEQAQQEDAVQDAIEGNLDLNSIMEATSSGVEHSGDAEDDSALNLRDLLSDEGSLGTAIHSVLEKNFGPETVIRLGESSTRDAIASVDSLDPAMTLEGLDIIGLHDMGSAFQDPLNFNPVLPD